ncbi:GNAT family N-acetyltransferase [Microbacterium sp. 179-B 1A2 NHS]|uniref:GNAT family N-acetyltransferase n=1 Tax=Microbacterium sp. 179-B 1A2 NHS TaxID=3142383 RepID=UPI00399F3D62
MAETDTRVARNTARNRYEIFVGETVAGYTLAIPDADTGRTVLPHTVIDPAFRGRGLSGVLIGGALADLAASGETVVPDCPSVAKYLHENEVEGLSVAERRAP